MSQLSEQSATSFNPLCFSLGGIVFLRNYKYALQVLFLPPADAISPKGGYKFYLRLLYKNENSFCFIGLYTRMTRHVY